MTPDEKRAADRAYYHKNRETLLAKEKARQAKRMSTDEGREDYARYHRDYRKTRGRDDPMYMIRHRVSTTKYRANKAGVPFNLTWGYIIDNWTGRCALTDIPFQFVYGQDRERLISPYSPSLDRIDPKRGYVEGNVRWVLNAVNCFKGTGTDEDILHIARALLEHSAATAAHATERAA